MFTRENLPGFALLGLCAVVVVALLVEIFTDIRWEYTGPAWLANSIAIIGMGLVFYMAWKQWGSRLVGRKNDEENSWPGNDVRTRKRKDDEKDGN